MTQSRPNGSISYDQIVLQLANITYLFLLIISMNIQVLSDLSQCETLTRMIKYHSLLKMGEATPQRTSSAMIQPFTFTPAASAVPPARSLRKRH